MNDSFFPSLREDQYAVRLLETNTGILLKQDGMRFNNQLDGLNDAYKIFDSRELAEEFVSTIMPISIDLEIHIVNHLEVIVKMIRIAGKKEKEKYWWCFWK